MGRIVPVPSYIRAHADLIRSFVAEGGGQGTDLLFLMYAVLLRAKGAGVTASDVHDVWSAWAESEGRSDDTVIPFDQLPRVIQAKDEVYVQAIHRAAARMSIT